MVFSLTGFGYKHNSCHLDHHCQHTRVLPLSRLGCRTRFLSRQPLITGLPFAHATQRLGPPMGQRIKQLTLLCSRHQKACRLMATPRSILQLPDDGISLMMDWAFACGNAAQRHVKHCENHVQQATRPLGWQHGQGARTSCQRLHLGSRHHVHLAERLKFHKLVAHGCLVAGFGLIQQLAQLYHLLLRTRSNM